MNVIMIVLTLMLANRAGTASHYHDKFQGRKTASGEIYDKNKLTCAATSAYKLGDKLQVTNQKTGESVVVKVNDRGQLYGRSVDLSKAAFKQIAPIKQGIVKVFIKKL